MTRSDKDDTLHLAKDDLDFIEQEKFQVEEKIIYSGRKRGAFVVFITGPSRGNAVTVHQGKMIVGRDRTCDIVVNKQYVSKKHAEIFVSGDKVEIVDCGSTNGTFVNDALIERAVLRDRDEIKIGSVIMQYFCIDLNDARQEPALTAGDHRKQSVFYGKVAKEVQPFFGQMTTRFLDRQIKAHLGKTPHTLSVSDKEALAKWLRVSAGLLLDAKTAETLADKILALE
jgi:pSer/pThr/pTyr-binding forkhead associated (FHA) protein